MQSEQQGQHESAYDKKDVTIFITSMRGKKEEFTFPKTAKVSEVIAAAVVKFGLAPGDKFDVVFPEQLDKPLDHNRTLQSYHVKDGTELLLTSTGGGV